MTADHSVFDTRHIWTVNTALGNIVSQVEEYIEASSDSIGIIYPGELVCEIDISAILGLRFNGGKYSSFDPEPVVRAHLYRYLYDLKYMQDLEDKLTNNSDIASQFGFDPDNTPDRSTLSTWWNDYFGDDIRTVIEKADEKVKNYIFAQGIPLDSALYDPEERTGGSTETKQRVSEETAEEIIHKNRQWVYELLDLPIAGNSIYDDDNYHDLMTAIALEKNFAHSGAHGFEKHLRDKYDCADEDYVSPSSDSLLYHLKKFNEDELLEMFTNVLDRLRELSEDRYEFFSKPVDLAIDENAVPTHIR